MMTKTGNQFAQVQFPLDISVPEIEQTLIFCFLQYKMDHHPQFVHVVENDLPLVELAHVEAVPNVRVRPHPGVAPVAAVEVVREKVDAVHGLSGEVVERADHALALADIFMKGDYLTSLECFTVLDTCSGMITETDRVSIITGLEKAAGTYDKAKQQLTRELIAVLKE